ncbi:hypothetical protein KOW79_000388 [Hemibagrus wyckioides]|uniref:Uncharacterized protein n=1 Tax=Hemibagrus wyckioides TaxID=337641 RepID=A0A9D3P6K2_9TELE|nr:hypothetical protein KOW79_000388 [Hemibagrus wyckioides]
MDVKTRSVDLGKAIDVTFVRQHARSLVWKQVESWGPSFSGLDNWSQVHDRVCGMGRVWHMGLGQDLGGLGGLHIGIYMLLGLGGCHISLSVE